VSGYSDSHQDDSDIAVSLAVLWPETNPADDEEGSYLDNERLIIAERRKKASELYLAKWSMRKIADELKVSLRTVQRDIHAVLDGWEKYTKQNYSRLIVNELARLAHRESDIEIEWEKSKGEVTETSTGKRRVNGNTHDTAAVKKKQRYGDPRLAQLLLRCWELRCKLLKLLTAEDVLQKDKVIQGVKLVAGIAPGELV